MLLIGMDTPQVTPALLESFLGRSDAVLGLSEDGGFWAIGLRGVDPAAGVRRHRDVDRTHRSGPARLG